MVNLEHGFKRAFQIIIGGSVVYAILTAFIDLGILDQSFMILFSILNIVAIVILFTAMPYWGTAYIFGWLFGLYIIFKDGLIGKLEVTIYILIPVILIILRIRKSLRDYYNKMKNRNK